MLDNFCDTKKRLDNRSRIWREFREYFCNTKKRKKKELIFKEYLGKSPIDASKPVKPYKPVKKAGNVKKNKKPKKN